MVLLPGTDHLQSVLTQPVMLLCSHFMSCCFWFWELQLHAAKQHSSGLFEVSSHQLFALQLESDPPACRQSWLSPPWPA